MLNNVYWYYKVEGVLIPFLLPHNLLQEIVIHYIRLDVGQMFMYL